jgi:hypothetical protein
MFDDNHMDDLMKSILYSGQEEVPAHVWDGISEGLDHIERRRKVVLWVRRAGVTAAAAAIALGVFLNMDQNQTIVPEATDSQMIAIAEPEVEIVQAEENEIATTPARDLLAYVKPKRTDAESPVVTVTEDNIDQDIETTATDSNLQADATIPSQPSETPVPKSDINSKTIESFEPADLWVEDDKEIKERKIRTSLVISGVAGTNNPQSKEGLSPMKSPALGKQYTKTTIEQTSTETLYGIPLSFGAGVRLHFAERWSLGMGLNYTLLTSKFNGKYIKVTDGVEEAPVAGNIRNTQHYIGIPINAYYDIVSKDFINLYAYAGGTVEKCIMNRYQVQATSMINHSEDVNGVQLSANAGIGVEFRLGRYVGLYIDPSLRYYFNNGQPKSIRSSQPLMLGFEAGLRFNL